MASPVVSGLHFAAEDNYIWHRALPLFPFAIFVTTSTYHEFSLTYMLLRHPIQPDAHCLILVLRLTSLA